MDLANHARNIPKLRITAWMSADVIMGITEHLLILEAHHVHVSFKLSFVNQFAKIFFFILEPPSAPQNLSAIFVDQSNVILTWSPPDYLGGRTDTRYRVKCDACGGQVQFTPNTVRLSTLALNRPTYILSLFYTGVIQRNKSENHGPKRCYDLPLPNFRWKRCITHEFEIGGICWHSGYNWGCCAEQHYKC